MKLDRYYYITSLPALGELGSDLPVGFVGLQEYLGDDHSRRELVGSLFLLDDLLQREAYLAGELQEATPAILSEKQVRNESPLPEFLLSADRREMDGVAETNTAISNGAAPTGEERDRISVDATWEAYFRYVADVAEQRKCEFLTAWVRYEVALRNSLASFRARSLGVDETDFLVAIDLAEECELITHSLSDWENAQTPLAGHRALIRSRWDWLKEHDWYFTFRDDEIAAYALRLMLLKQWRCVMDDQQEDTQ